jgi:hypothetical protein
MLAARPAGQADRVPRSLPAVTLTVISLAAPPRYAQVARAQSPPALAPGLCYHDHEPQREAPVPIDDRVQQLITGRQRPMPGALAPRGVPARLALGRSCTGLWPARWLSRLPPPARRSGPGTSPCSAGLQIIAAGIPAVAGGAGPGKTFLPGRIRHGPSMYEMEGPCPASPRRLASCLVFAALRAPPAGARHPRERPVSRLLPRSRRRPRVVPVSSGESISTTAASTAQGPAASHFLFFRYPRRNPQKAGSYPHFTAVIHGFYSQPAHRLPGVSRRTPEPLSSHARSPVAGHATRQRHP